MQRRWFVTAGAVVLAACGTGKTGEAVRPATPTVALLRVELVELEKPAPAPPTPVAVTPAPAPAAAPRRPAAPTLTAATTSARSSRTDKA